MSERMSDEQIAEVRAAALRAMEHLEGDGSSTETCVQAMPYLLDEIERGRRGGKELGKTLVFLAELIKGAFRRGETDPIGALLMLGDHLAHLFEDEGGLSADEHNRIYRALEARREGGV